MKQISSTSCTGLGWLLSSTRVEWTRWVVFFSTATPSKASASVGVGLVPQDVRAGPASGYSREKGNQEVHKVPEKCHQLCLFIIIEI